VPAVPLCSPQLLTGAQFSLSQITVEFVYQQLKALNSKKSSGLHDIPIWLVKDGTEALARPLTLLMTRTIDEGSLLGDWKHAVVMLVHKAGSKSDPSNFWPISVLPIFSKILFHGYNTRSCDLLRPPYAKTTKFQGSFRINGT